MTHLDKQTLDESRVVIRWMEGEVVRLKKVVKDLESKCDHKTPEGKKAVREYGGDEPTWHCTMCGAGGCIYGGYGA